MPARQLAPVLDEVDEHVVAQGVMRREEGTTPVELSYLLDEVPQVPSRVQGEGVYPDPFARAAQDLLQRRIDRGGHRWVAEEHLAVLEKVRGGLAVGDHHDLLGALVARKQAPRQ